MSQGVDVYDLRGLTCPMPVLKVRRRLRDMPPGAMLTVRTSDPLAGLDIPAFCREDGHILEAVERTSDGHLFRIRHRGAPAG